MNDLRDDDDEAPYDHEAELEPDITQIFARLPGFEEDVYLRMQATNLHLVDGYIRELERSLLREYFEIERTPVPAAMFVSALSQLWVLGLYELLRTWRQRVRNVLKFSQRIVDDRSSAEAVKEQVRKDFVRSRTYPQEIAAFAFAVYERVQEDPRYAERLRAAFDASELLFRRIEALRMMLAKHELPGQKGVAAMAPGYGRIDMTNGSIYWQVELSDYEVDVVSRRAIAQGLAALAENVDHRVLSPQMQEKVRACPKFSYGLKKVTVELADGAKFPDTLIAWNKIVVDVLGHHDVPFDANQIVGVIAEEGSILAELPENDSCGAPN
jgi:hypothetical protein